ncbi:hypothetical protein Ae201684_008838 [Aphanomyces euteiches]|uniref:Uncharacterized protein n=1 Tax=Aphanomyces euteiches TaxID=100861 RepID=A0A6G0X3L6_9STRA|nr:hypothetical protein Ae201684_008838 [Aphanomyces euteiches]
MTPATSKFNKHIGHAIHASAPASLCFRFRFSFRMVLYIVLKAKAMSNTQSKSASGRLDISLARGTKLFSTHILTSLSMTPLARESCVLQFLSLRIPVGISYPLGLDSLCRLTIERAGRMIFYLICWDVCESSNGFNFVHNVVSPLGETTTHIVNCDWKFCQLNINSISATQHSFQDRFKSLIYLSVTSLDLLQKYEIWWDASRMHFRHRTPFLHNRV